MKVILSRKGFDSSHGGSPSPILDGTLLSMPIPSENDNDAKYDDLCYNGVSYSNILEQLHQRKNFSGCHCHADPDIRQNNRKKNIINWKPAFGQCGTAQRILTNAGVDKNDIFLFFGWFHQVEKINGKYKFVSSPKTDFYRSSDLHIIYGYLEIGEQITDPNEICKYFWHPHSNGNYINNTLYIPTEHLSFNKALPGYGTLDFRKDRVLTKKNCNRATWNAYDFLMPEHIYGNRKNSAKSDGLYYAGQWQELVIYESEELIDWVKNILK